MNHTITTAYLALFLTLTACSNHQIRGSKIQQQLNISNLVDTLYRKAPV